MRDAADDTAEVTEREAGEFAAVIRLIEERARPIILKYFGEDSCIASTKVVLGVLATFGIEAQPVVVETLAFNPAMVRRVEAEGRMPVNLDETTRWSSECGSWSVGIGMEADYAAHSPGGWPGHLVAVSGMTLIDASLGQANRPQRGLYVPPALVMAVTRDFMLSGKWASWWLEDGSVVMYRRHSSDRLLARAMAAPDWRISGRTRPIIKALLDRLELDRPATQPSTQPPSST